MLLRKIRMQLTRWFIIIIIVIVIIVIIIIINIISLLNLKNDEWGDKVQVIATDMREWKATEKADIIVSELLGSFGDNELSPECLDGAQSFLKGFFKLKNSFND
jgi:hypothetical protein